MRKRSICSEFFFFNKVVGWRPVTLLERDFDWGDSSEFCEIFQEHLYYIVELNNGQLLAKEHIVIRSCIYLKD